MPRVDFYVLAERGSREQFTCDIAARIRQQELQIYIHAGSAEEATMLDDLLWTHRDTSFLPHSLIDAEDSDTNTITIGWDDMSAKHHDVLINLGENIPDFAGNCDRVVEIVAADNIHRQQARERYRQYRQASFEIINHDL